SDGADEAERPARAEFQIIRERGDRRYGQSGRVGRRPVDQDSRPCAPRGDPLALGASGPGQRPARGGADRRTGTGHKAVLLVSAFGKGPDTAHVDVIPALPTVFSIHAPERVGDGDTITLRGYKLNELASATTSKITTSPSAPVTIYSADSATVRFGIPTLPADPTCSPGAAATKINTTGARPLVDLTVSRKREDEVVLGVGE